MPARDRRSRGTPDVPLDVADGGDTVAGDRHAPPGQQLAGDRVEQRAVQDHDIGRLPSECHAHQPQPRRSAAARRRAAPEPRTRRTPCRLAPTHAMTGSAPAVPSGEHITPAPTSDCAIGIWTPSAHGTPGTPHVLTPPAHAIGRRGSAAPRHHLSRPAMTREARAVSREPSR